jgi:hypothetical protein
MIENLVYFYKLYIFMVHAFKLALFLRMNVPVMSKYSSTAYFVDGDFQHSIVVPHGLCPELPTILQ